MESKPLPNMVGFKEPSFTDPDPRVVDGLPAETANSVENRLLHMNPTVRGTRQGE